MTVSHLMSEHNVGRGHNGHNGTAPSLETLIVSVPVSAEKLAEVKTHFKKVHVFAEDETVTKEAAREAEVWYCNWFGIPKEIEYEDVPNLKLVQLTSGKTLSSSIPFPSRLFPLYLFSGIMGLSFIRELAGANLALNSPALRSEEARKKIDISSASGKASPSRSKDELLYVN